MRWLGVVAALLIAPGPAALADTETGPPRIHSLRGHFELVPLALTGLTASDSAVRARCAFILGRTGSRRCRTAIRPLLGDASRAVRYQAGIALCSLGDEAGLTSAGAALASADEWIRYYAVGALADLGTEAARRALVSLTPDQPELIRNAIEGALKEWPHPASPPERARRELGPYQTLPGLFGGASDVLVVESDRYWHVGEYLQCVRCNGAAAFLTPDQVDLYSTSAWLLWSLGLNERAISLLHQGVDAKPRSWEAWFNLGYQYVLMKQYNPAVRALRRSVELGAPQVNHRQYCHALEKAGHPDLALKEWRGLLETYPTDAIAPRQIARLEKVLRGEPPEPPKPGGDSV